MALQAARRKGGRRARRPAGDGVEVEQTPAVVRVKDVKLTSSGEKPALVLACGALANEIIALRSQLGVAKDALVLHCLPAELHNRPSEIAPRVDAWLNQNRSQFGPVLIGYGDCGTGGALDIVLEKHDAQRLPHAHCYEFFATTPIFEDIIEAELGSFFVTDFLVRHFDRLIWQGLAIDKHPEMRELFFGNYRDLVYLAQTETPMLQIKAREAANRIGLNYKFRPVGFGDLEAAIAGIGSVSGAGLGAGNANV